MIPPPSVAPADRRQAVSPCHGTCRATSPECGEPAKILVEGQHPWRGTVVTIGAHRPKRIFVLPNWKGILAEFDPTGAQATRLTGSSSTSVLRVRASEGVSRLHSGITITG